MESGEVQENIYFQCFFVTNMKTILLDEIIQLWVHGDVAPTGSCAIFFLADLLLLIAGASNYWPLVMMRTNDSKRSVPTNRLPDWDLGVD